MKKISDFILTFSLVGFIISCDKKENNLIPNVDEYPMTVGTEWTYDRQVIMKKYESETSDKVIDIDTIVFKVKVWIDKDTVLNDTMNVKVFKSRESDYNWISSQYKYLDNEGLRNYAYSSTSGSNVFAENSSGLKSSHYYLKLALENVGGLTNGEIIFEDKPTLDIKLPLDKNSSWTYRQPSETRALQIDKKVIGTETLSLIEQNIACFKIYWDYIYDPVFNGIHITDWISEKGLMKRQTIYDRTTLITQYGEPINGNVQMTETLILKELKMK